MHFFMLYQKTTIKKLTVKLPQSPLYGLFILINVVCKNIVKNRRQKLVCALQRTARQ
jgi:hypothetical protein